VIIFVLSAKTGLLKLTQWKSLQRRR